MHHMRLPENFSTSLLTVFFADLRKEEPRRNSVLDLEIETASGKRKLRELFPFSTNADVWMCPDLCKSIREWGQEPTEGDRNYYGQKRPDIWCKDEAHILFVENKTGGGRRLDQETRYLDYLLRKVPQKLNTGFFYLIPDRWTRNSDNSWDDFLREKTRERVKRGLVKWDSKLVSLLCDRLELPCLLRKNLEDLVQIAEAAP